MIIDETTTLMRGSTTSLDRLIDADFLRLYPKLVALFRGKGAGAEEASDLAQETLLAAFRNQSHFRGDSELDTWVYGIGKKQWLQHKRDGRRRKRDGVEISVDAELVINEVTTALTAVEPGPEEILLAREKYRRVAETLPTLPEEMRRPLVMYIHAGLPYAEISSRLGVSINRVSSLIHQARQKLRRAVEGKAEARW